ncbi:sensor histidine kinase [Lewinella sp. IMCC34183]|uniref:sensor histidine kinase n=1 Tax=Lewinella sp. IMCC34183 TaxID=2248762 RepID=UPI000E26D419|nr:histidine kinase [Lewinella sp. IMCC34183]
MERLRLSRLTLQVLAWVGLWALVFLVLGGDVASPGRSLRRLLPLLATIGVVVALNGLVLLPRLYFRGRRGGYLLAAVLLVIVATLVAQNAGFSGRRFPVLYERMSRNRSLGLGTLRYALPIATSLLGSVVFEVMRYAGFREREAVRAQREQLATELKFLKSQVNPHFLFNSLNNIYTLTLLHDEKAPESLLRLSGMLRYMLYDSETESVALGREIAYIRDFIALRRLKDSRGMDIRVELDDRWPELRIAPLLLIPFVENAFKHSRVEDLEDGYVKIKLTTSDVRSTSDVVLTFSVVNSVPARTSPADRVGGIGLENVRKRLELLYPGRHHLRILPGGNTFTVELKLDLP